MTDTEALRNRWDDLHSQPRYLPVYPNEGVVRWLRRSFTVTANDAPHIIDIGCGGGRHSLTMARDGFRVTASDLSPVGVAAVASRAAEEGLTIDTTTAPMHEIPYPDGHFDGIVCFGVLNYVPVDVVEETVVEFERILKPGGRFHIMVRGDQDWRIRFARPTKPNEYILEGLEDTPAAAEESLEMTLFDRPLIDRLFARFEDVKIDWCVTGQGEGRYNNSDWYISGQKC